MQFAIRLIISICIITLCAHLGRKLPALAGLIAVMPLTGVIVMLWIYSDDPGNFARMTRYTSGALWGIGPSILFFLTALLCFRKHLPLWLVLCASFGVWILAAFAHQWLLNR
jgi:uncharacterized membrane protein (GlpM family)